MGINIEYKKMSGFPPFTIFMTRPDMCSSVECTREELIDLKSKIDAVLKEQDDDVQS